jgi:hypothetical protein
MPFSFGATSLRDEDDLVSFLGRADQVLYDSRAQRSDVNAGTVIPLLPPDARGTGRRRPRRAV